MHKLFKSRVVAVSAGALLVVGLGSTAAVGHGMITSDDISDFSVRKHHIGGGQVGPFELRHQSVGSPQINNNSIRYRDLRPFVQNKLDEQGPAGPKGEPGEDGTDGVSGYEVIGRGTDSMTGNNAQQTAVAACANNKTAISGGLKSGTADVTTHESYPSDISEVTDPTNRPESDPNGIWHATSWTVEFTAPNGAEVQPFVVCMTPGEVPAPE